MATGKPASWVDDVHLGSRIARRTTGSCYEVIGQAGVEPRWELQSIFGENAGWWHSSTLKELFRPVAREPAPTPPTKRYEVADLNAVLARVALARREAPPPWRPGFADKDSIFIPYAEGLAGPHGERVLLRANKGDPTEPFPYENVIRFIGGAIDEVPMLAAEVLRLLEENAVLREQMARSGNLVKEMEASWKRIDTGVAELAEMVEALGK